MASRDVDGLNAGYASLLLDEYLENPEAVPAEWRALFEGGGAADLLAGHPGLQRLLETLGDGNGHAVVESPAATAPQAPAAAPAAAPDETLLAGVAAAMSLVKAHRTHGHLVARLDPLGSEPPGEPALEELRYDPPLTPELQERIPASLLRLHVAAETLRDALPKLREVYCGTIAYEIEHITDHAERVWLREAIESGRYRRPLAAEQRIALLRAPVAGRGVRALSCAARSSGRSGSRSRAWTSMVPMLDEAIELGAAGGAHEVVIGMAHRGRLNVLAHTVGRPYESILREFEGERAFEAVVADPEGGTGDVKYHLGARGTRTTADGELDDRRSRRIRATSRPSTRSSRAAPAPSRPTAPAAPASTTRPSRCRS